MDPAKDRELQAEVKAKRVMTVFQDSVGNKADRGVVGFEPGPSRQFLVFPKPLRGFEGRNVVGIKYDLLSDKEPPKSERAPTIKAKKPKKTKTKPVPLPANVLIMPAPHSGDGSEAKDRKEDHSPSKTTSLKSPERETPKAAQRKAREAKVPKVSPPVPAADAAELKAGIRKALKALEQGKQVVAFNLLKRLAGE